MIRFLLLLLISISLMGCVKGLPFNYSPTVSYYEEENVGLMPGGVAGTDAGAALKKGDNYLTGYVQFPLVPSDTLIEYNRDFDIWTSNVDIFRCRMVQPDIGYGLTYLRALNNHLSLGIKADFASAPRPDDRVEAMDKDFYTWQMGVLVRANWEVGIWNFGGSVELGGGTTEYWKYRLDYDSTFVPHNDSSVRTVGYFPFTHTFFSRWHVAKRFVPYMGFQTRFLPGAVLDTTAETDLVGNLYFGAEVPLTNSLVIQCTYSISSRSGEEIQPVHSLGGSLSWHWNRNRDKAF